MTLKQKLNDTIITNIIIVESVNQECYDYNHVELAEHCEQIAQDFTIDFTQWKDNNFHKYRDNTYYANTSSRYFDITKYVGKEKPTVYCTIQSLMEMYKKEKQL